MSVFAARVVFLAGCADGIDVNQRAGEKRQMRHELLMHVRGDVVSVLDGQRRIDGNVHFREQLMSEPAGAHFLQFAHSGYMRGGVLHLREHVGFNTIERQTITRMAAVIRRPMIGSATGKPSQTPTAPPNTARLVQPSVRAW